MYPSLPVACVASMSRGDASDTTSQITSSGRATSTLYTSAGDLSAPETAEETLRQFRRFVETQKVCTRVVRVKEENKLLRYLDNRDSSTPSTSHLQVQDMLLRQADFIGAQARRTSATESDREGGWLQDTIYRLSERIRESRDGYSAKERILAEGHSLLRSCKLGWWPRVGLSRVSSIKKAQATNLESITMNCKTLAYQLSEWDRLYGEPEISGM